MACFTQRNPQHVPKTKRPLVLTVNGKAAAMGQDADAYQWFLDLAAEVSAAEGIRQGLGMSPAAAPARHVRFSTRSAPNMIYCVELTARATAKCPPQFEERPSARYFD